MTTSNYRAIDSWLTRLLDLPADQREAEIENIPAALRPAVEDLLQDALTGDAFLTGRAEARGLLVASDLEGEALIGRLVGPYRILSEIGAGGMGRVYLGERADGLFERQVAIKVVHVDATRTDRETLLRELRILAGLEHPGIAQLYDAGLTDDGDPFVVMERIDGRRIDQYCEEERLTPRHRLELLLEVCGAVQAAHQRLIVHRDLKPSNILVDQTGTAKLLDFGIASILDNAGSEEAGAGESPSATRSPTLQPRHGDTQRRSWFTPSYASPEQRRGEAVTTASDVFQLGLLAERLLIGDNRSASVEEAVDSVSTHEETTLSTIPLDRGIARDDLQAILSKALAVDSAQRYPSADRLQEDLSNLLQGRPVAARDATLLYQAARFWSRHRISISASLFALLLLVALSIGFTLRLAAERDATRREAAAAERAATETQQVLDFLSSLFRTANPLSLSHPTNSGPDITVRELLERSADQLDESIVDEPMVRAKILTVLGNIYRSLGLDSQAESLLAEGLELRETNPAVRPRDLAESRLLLGRLRDQQGRYDEAKPLVERAIETYRSDDVPVQLASALHILSMVETSQGDAENALAHQEESSALWRALGRTDREAEVLIDSGHSLIELGRIDEAFEKIQHAIDTLQAKHGSGHFTVIKAKSALADVYTALGEPLKVIETLLPAREALIATLGEDDFRLAVIDNNLGVAFTQSDQQEKAKIHLELALATFERWQPDHPDTGQILSNLGTIEWALGQPKRAEEYYRQALEVLRRTHPDQHPWIFRTIFNLGEALYGQDDLNGAKEQLDYALELFEARLGPNHALVSVPLLYLAQIADRWGESARAEELFERTLTIREATDDPAFLKEVVDPFADWLRRQGREPEAEALELSASDP